MTSEKIRLLCVDDHPLVREGIAALINAQPDMTVVASAESGEQAIALFRSVKPEVTLLDLRLPRLSGLDTIRAIRRADPEAKIIVVTMYSGEENVYRALEAGAATYLLKDALPEDLANTIRSVHAGQRPVTSIIETKLTERTGHAALTPREIQVIELLAQGMRNKEIAATLNLAEDTVRVHLKRVYAKLGVSDRTAVIRIAVHRGIVHMQA